MGQIVECAEAPWMPTTKVKAYMEIHCMMLTDTNVARLTTTAVSMKTMVYQVATVIKTTAFMITTVPGLVIKISLTVCATTWAGIWDLTLGSRFVSF